MATALIYSTIKIDILNMTTALIRTRLNVLFLIIPVDYTCITSRLWMVMVLQIIKKLRFFYFSNHNTPKIILRVLKVLILKLSGLEVMAFRSFV